MVFQPSKVGHEAFWEPLEKGAWDSPRLEISSVRVL
jgi:hypothetical protein